MIIVAFREDVCAMLRVCCTLTCSTLLNGCIQLIAEHCITESSLELFCLLFFLSLIRRAGHSVSGLHETNTGFA